MKFYLLLSVVLHVLLLVNFPNPEKISPQEPTPLTLIYKVPSTNATNGNDKKISPEKTQFTQKFDFSPKFSMQANSNVSNEINPKPHSENMDVKTQSKSVFSTMNLSNSLSMEPALMVIWRLIDRQLTYPAPFVKRRLEGAVTAYIKIDESGKFRINSLKLTGTSVFLKTYVAFTLTYVFKNLKPSSNGSLKSTILIFNFDFRGYAKEDREQVANLKTFKNTLHFIRYKRFPPKLNDHIDHVFTNYVPPVIPIPGGLFIDFVRAYKMFKNLTDEEYRTRDKVEFQRFNELIKKRKKKLDETITIQ